MASNVIMMEAMSDALMCSARACSDRRKKLAWIKVTIDTHSINSLWISISNEYSLLDDK
jgi:hypothetical protein